MSEIMKNPTDESDHVHEEHDDQHRVLRIVQSRFPFPLYNLMVFKVFPSPYGIAASCSRGLYDLVLVSVVSQFCRRSDASPLFICHSVKFFHVGLRVSLFVHTHLVLLGDCSLILFLRGTQVVSGFLDCL